MSSSNDSREAPWYGRPSFVMSAAVVALVVVLGIYLLFPRSSGSTPPTTPTPTPSVASATPAPGTCPTLANDELRPGMALETAPKATEWTPLKFSSVASITGQGPARTEPSGYRHCYARTLDGAALAAANYSAQIVDPDLWEEALRLGAVQEPGMEQQIEQMREQGVNRAGDKFTVVGLTQVTATSPDSVTVGLVVVTGDTTVGTDLSLQWDGTDWRVQPRVETSRAIDDYMVWGR
jgi:hypothetical protein